MGIREIFLIHIQKVDLIKQFFSMDGLTKISNINHKNLNILI